MLRKYCILLLSEEEGRSVKRGTYTCTQALPILLSHNSDALVSKNGVQIPLKMV